MHWLSFNHLLHGGGDVVNHPVTLTLLPTLLTHLHRHWSINSVAKKFGDDTNDTRLYSASGKQHYLPTQCPEPQNTLLEFSNRLTPLGTALNRVLCIDFQTFSLQYRCSFLYKIKGGKVYDIQFR